jgi:hypothetical protein
MEMQKQKNKILEYKELFNKNGVEILLVETPTFIIDDKEFSVYSRKFDSLDASEIVKEIIKVEKPSILGLLNVEFLKISEVLEYTMLRYAIIKTKEEYTNI